jgi:DNA-binding XRE family transcriptional regulator
MTLTGRHVAAARGLLAMTQSDLAAAAGVTRQTLIDWEAGTRIPRSDTVDKVRDALERRGIEFSNGGEPGVKYRPAKALIPV